MMDCQGHRSLTETEILVRRDMLGLVVPLLAIGTSYTHVHRVKVIVHSMYLYNPNASMEQLVIAEIVKGKQLQCITIVSL